MATGAGAVPGRGLRTRRFERAVWKVTLPRLFASMMDMAVQHRAEPKLASSGERLRESCVPQPRFGRDRPKRDMRRTRPIGVEALLPLRFVGEPGELLGAEVAHAAGL